MIILILQDCIIITIITIINIINTSCRMGRWPADTSSVAADNIEYVLEVVQGQQPTIVILARPSGYSTRWLRPAGAHRRLRNSRTNIITITITTIIIITIIIQSSILYYYYYYYIIITIVDY